MLNQKSLQAIRFLYIILIKIKQFRQESETMTRMGKQEKRRNMYPKKRQVNLSEKTGPKKDHLEHGFRVHDNASDSNPDFKVFIPKMIKR